MANHTAVPEDEYDVLIDGDLSSGEGDPCDRSGAAVLSAQQAAQLCSALFMVGLLANGWLLFILIKYKGLRHVENIYFLNVALSNLCFLLPLPFWAAAAWPRSVCGVLLALQSFGLHGEALFTVLLTVHASRVRGLSSALRTATWGVIMALLAWLTAFLVTLPELVFYKPPRDEQSSLCSISSPHFLPAEETSWKRVLTLKMNAVVLVFPLLVLLGGCLGKRSGEEQRERSGLVRAVAVVFLLMWLPYNIVLFLSAFKECFSLRGCQSDSRLDAGARVAKVIGTAHCWVNPPLYALLDPPLRSRLCGLLPRRGHSPPRPGGGESARGPLRGSQDRSTRL
ncbi:C-C chemokine receptor-like 2 [Heterocephalus glaber]|uniref:C-C chemokine receptor-like 2 n=1 Tax=Heterocephalus glaber TaxID=10181 RepID=G5ANP3_HETGA|nr:C-C chemokine receptor-like 2 [Heterocephalus glaber]EHA98653.1 C-C chemokine receptor-like 2 [Heterocephalus glaber]